MAAQLQVSQHSSICDSNNDNPYAKVETLIWETCFALSCSEILGVILVSNQGSWKRFQRLKMINFIHWINYWSHFLNREETTKAEPFLFFPLEAFHQMTPESLLKKQREGHLMGKARFIILGGKHGRIGSRVRFYWMPYSAQILSALPSKSAKEELRAEWTK